MKSLLKDFANNNTKFENVTRDEQLKIDGGAGVPEGYEGEAIGAATGAGSLYDSGRRHSSTTSNRGGGGGLQLTPH